jgi:hypothetical protein
MGKLQIYFIVTTQFTNPEEYRLTANFFLAVEILMVVINAIISSSLFFAKADYDVTFNGTETLEAKMWKLLDDSKFK